MNRRTHATAAFLLAAGPLLCLPGSARPQLIQVKTVPVATGDQFLLFPSQNLGMGSVGLAMPDTLGDPFSNPAAGSRVSKSVFFGSPTFYGVSGGNGSGRSLPLGALFTSGTWFGGAAFSLQELKGAERGGVWRPWFTAAALDVAWSSPPQDLSEASARNLYAFGLVGYRVPDAGLSIGVSGFYADLGAVDGVDLLYALSQEIRQSGHLSDVRVGLLKEWEENRSLELVLTRNRLRMRHDVTYLDLVWLPDPDPSQLVPQWQTRVEENLDHTDTWGFEAAYRKPLNDRGWRIGWSATTNRKDHPKIPNYEIQNIPRDPGNTWAYALGVGIAKTEGPARFAADVILEPITSDTWATAIADTVSVTGKVIRAGEKTVENDFTFTNVHLRAGAAVDYRSATFQAGLQVRSVSYTLDQLDRIQVEQRDQDESWMEWTPSLGLSLHLPGVSLQYAGRLTTGTGRPGTRWTAARMADAGVPALDGGSDFLLAPSGPLTLQDARVATHQLTIVVPMG